MQETDFHRLADATLDALADALETADATGALEVESENGTLTIRLPSGKTYVVSKHAPTKQLWLASPVSGGLHFGYSPSPLWEWVGGGEQFNNCGVEYVATPPPPQPSPTEGGGSWMLPDGRTLFGILAEELETAGIEVRF